MMSIEISDIGEGRILEVHATGRLTREDYERFAPVIEQRIKRHGKLRILLVLHDFHGWDAGALWEDVKFDMRHFNDIERLAIVGEAAWEKGMAIFCKPFTTAQIRYFDHGETEQARQWIQE
jgi:stage II sporulation SpoAA-like protein